MFFEISHSTEYRYLEPAMEAYLEARLTPPTTFTQRVIEHEIRIDPELPTSSYTDTFGNPVSFFAYPLRHKSLSVVNHAVVQTLPPTLPKDALEMPVAEVRQVFASSLVDYFDYLQPTPTVPVGGPSAVWARKCLKPSSSLSEGLGVLNASIHEGFRYESGSTDNWTPLPKIWRERRGVCQDFAHVMLSVLRTAGLPARYVCGYIETAPPRSASGRRLVGSVATHAWVEVLTPGMVWVALDPTNNQWCAEQHVAVSFGRDSRDAAPVRGTFKGAGGQVMKVRVNMKRVKARA